MQLRKGQQIFLRLADLFRSKLRWRLIQLVIQAYLSVARQYRQRFNKHAHGKNDETSGVVFLWQGAALLDQQVRALVRKNSDAPWLDVMRRWRVYCRLQQRFPNA